jgi:predicted MFS family arabinose efflux permease
VVAIVADMLELVGLTGLLSLSGAIAVPDGIAVPLADHLRADPASVGWILAAHPVGMAVGLYLTPVNVAAARERVARLALVTLVPLALAGPMLTVLPQLWCAVVLLGVSGVGMAFFSIVQTQFSLHAPHHLRGSLIGVGQTVLRVSQGIGVVLAGIVAGSRRRRGRACGPAGHMVEPASLAFGLHSPEYD